MTIKTIYGSGYLVYCMTRTLLYRLRLGGLNGIISQAVGQALVEQLGTCQSLAKIRTLKELSKFVVFEIYRCFY